MDGKVIFSTAQKLSAQRFSAKRLAVKNLAAENLLSQPAIDYSVAPQQLKKRAFPYWRRLQNPARIYHRIGNLEVRLAASKKDVKKAQRVRYKVFYKEMSAIPDMKTKMKRRDIDAYDKICDHLLVLDHSASSRKSPFKRRTKVVGTYRILSEEKARANGGFYTQSEYDLAPLLKRKGHNHKFLELGRSCVLKPFRTKRSVEMLWHGLWAYIQEQEADVMIGCASFEGTDPKQHALALSFLHHHARAPKDWRVKAHDHLSQDMNMMAKEDIDMKKALKALPPLIKGYLRLGAYIGDGAVVDHQFGTTDILIIMPVAAIDSKYIAHFSTAHQALSAKPHLSSAYQSKTGEFHPVHKQELH
ncbi:MAG: hypothetical protein DHS20C08_17780 [Rhodomicrobium sp.]|nr:MAG: hypothetical protein DHS20C08_17780 [Rhodomicrobium sp.]